MITVGIPVTTRFDLLRRAVFSLTESKVRPDRVIILDQRNNCPEDAFDEIKAILCGMRIQLIWVAPERQISLSAAWNYFVRESDDWIVVANDDVVFYPDTIGSLIRSAEARPDGLVFVSNQDPTNRFSLFLIRRIALDIVGSFDEDIYPIYTEDRDFEYRMKLKGHHVIDVPDCRYGHEHSGTLKTKSPEETSKHWQQFAYLMQRYCAKWGGYPGQETYTEPFDAGRVKWPPEAVTA